MELFRALAALADSRAEELAPVAAALELGPPPDAGEYTELFLFQLYPYASVYLGAEGMIGGQARSLIAGFWRALGQSPPAEPDHLSLMLALYAHLVELERDERDALRREGLHQARRALLWEHLLSWLPVYLSKLETVAGPFYRKWGALLLEALVAEAKTVGEQKQLSLHLREAPGLTDPRAGGETEEFLQSLLSPARSGMILLRSDLTRAARKLGLGLRAGERKFILKALFGQDAEGLLAWLAEEARGARLRHSAQAAILGLISIEWERRAAKTESLLVELREDAARVEEEH